MVASVADYKQGYLDGVSAPNGERSVQAGGPALTSDGTAKGDYKEGYSDGVRAPDAERQAQMDADQTQQQAAQKAKQSAADKRYGKPK